MPTPNARYEGGRNVVKHVIPLGTGAVSTQTKLVGLVPKNGFLSRIRVSGQAAVTGTSITVQARVQNTAGSSASNLTAAESIKFASASAARVGVELTFTNTGSEREVLDGQQLEVIITCSSITAGPGDLSVEFELQPR